MRQENAFGAPMATLEDVLATIDADAQGALDRLFEFLRIPSVSAQSEHFPDCERAADWLTAQLAELGFEARKEPTEGRPMVVGAAKAKTRDAPHVLFYGHYDVQPPEPLELWTSPPFEPTLASGPTGERIVARGAADDKGQLMTFLEACRAFKANGGLPCHVSVLFEGEEETGSPSMAAFLAKNARALKADLLLLCDTGMWNAETPAITTMLRGLVFEEVALRGANRDLHSGIYGGPAINPIRVLARILADLHDDKGAVTLPGFYDGVEELPEEIAAQWRDLEFDPAKFLAGVGLSVPAGEAGRSVLEQLWSRPTCEFNGICGGYTGEGAKTVLPAEARAKVSFRLVGRQDPARIQASFRAFVKARLPADVKVEFLGHGGSPAIGLPARGEALRRARRALEEEWGKPAAIVGAGGSIPIVGAFKRELGMDALMVGFALEDDGMHSPNEKYDRRSFHKGARSWARILAALSQ
jgi:acetylornithine deacetylase/succinyl-diaminopimelate desuccinylase-like protein